MSKDVYGNILPVSNALSGSPLNWIIPTVSIILTLVLIYLVIKIVWEWKHDKELI